MQLPLQDFTALVRLQAAAVGHAARTLMDVSVGSVLRAILEANASVALWMQWLIMEVLSTTRAATSKGADLDSWVADFGLARLAAVPAQGEVRFSRITPGIRAVVPLGAMVRTGTTADAQTFEVVADQRRAEWTGAGYVIDASATEVVAPVRALTPGRAGNVQADVLRLLSTAVPGVDSVVNDFPLSGGLDAETDDALRTRFGGFIDSRSRATMQAVQFAVQSVRQGLQFTIQERVDAAGAFRAGHFTVVIDDGSGSASDELIAAVSAAIEVVRPVGGTFGVRRPALVRADVVIHVQGPADARSAVQAAVGGYIAGLPIGGWLMLSRIVQVAHDTDLRVSSVSGVLVNGASSNLVIPASGRVVPGTVMVLA